MVRIEIIKRYSNMKKDYIEPKSTEIELLPHAIVMASGDDASIGQADIEPLIIENDIWNLI